MASPPVTHNTRIVRHPNMPSTVQNVIMTVMGNPSITGWTNTLNSTVVPTMWSSPTTTSIPSYTNLVIYQDAQDMYVNGAGYMELKQGYDCNIKLPDGRTLRVEVDGTYSIDGDALAYTGSQTRGELKIREGCECVIQLPDGSFITVDSQANYFINDKDAEIIYRASRIREFNRFVNASDILEDFIRFVGTLGVSQSELMKLPVELFINFLIIKAAEADGEDTSSDAVVLESHPALNPVRHRHNARCRCCGIFIPKFRHQKGVEFCSPEHLEKYSLKESIW